MTYFISGHRDFTQEEFDKYYVPLLKKYIEEPDSRFVVGDYWGVDEKAQIWLKENLPQEEHTRVTVYHMYKKPRILYSTKFNQSGGYSTDVERDAAMTSASDIDIAFIHNGRWCSGTAQNILRRFEVGCSKSTPTYSDKIKSIKKVYKENDLSMSEILASTSANGLSIEDAFDIYIKLLNWSDGDTFLKQEGHGGDIINLE